MIPSFIKKRLGKGSEGKSLAGRSKLRKNLNLLLILPVLAALFHVTSCKKNQEDVLEKDGKAPLFAGGGGSGASSFDLSYSVVIHRNVTFQNGLTAASPGWKKLQAIPERESYSYHATVSNGNFYLLQDNIVVQSPLHDRMPLGEKIAKIEVANGITTSYDALGNVMNALPTGNLAQNLQTDLTGLVSPAAVNLNELTAQGMPYVVNGNTVTIVNLIANGNDNNSNALLNLSTGQPLLLMLYDDTDPAKLTTLAAYQYNASNVLQSSTFTYYDYLPDGDVRRKSELWAYTNYSLTIQ